MKETPMEHIAINTNGEAESLTTSLDLAEHNRNTSCGRWSVSGQPTQDAPDEWTHFRLYCKKWSCPFCGPRKAYKLKKAIITNATGLGLNKLMTLTLDPSKCAAEDSVTHIKDCWNKLRTYLKRKYGRTTSFITVLEFQKNGYAHLHVLVDSYVNQKWLSESWQALGGGRIVDIRFVDVQRIAHYLAKYLTKGMFLEHYGKNRRYTTSRGLTLFPKKLPNPKACWQIFTTALNNLIHIAGSRAVQAEYDLQGNLRSFKTHFSLLKDCIFLDDFTLMQRLKRGSKRNITLGHTLT